jgi:hypothetical protein
MGSKNHPGLCLKIRIGQIKVWPVVSQAGSRLEGGPRLGQFGRRYGQEEEVRRNGLQTSGADGEILEAREEPQ